MSILPPVWHPIFVHGPLVLLPLAALFATLALRHPWASRASGVTFLLAAATTGLALLAGDHDEESAGALSAGARQALEAHSAVGTIVGWCVGLLALAWLVRRGRMDRGAWRYAWPIALWAVAAFAALAGWLGGKLVYEYGVHMPAG